MINKRAFSFALRLTLPANRASSGGKPLFPVNFAGAKVFERPVQPQFSTQRAFTLHILAAKMRGALGLAGCKDLYE